MHWLQTRGGKIGRFPIGKELSKRRKFLEPQLNDVRVNVMESRGRRERNQSAESTNDRKRNRASVDFISSQRLPREEAARGAEGARSRATLTRNGEVQTGEGEPTDGETWVRPHASRRVGGNSRRVYVDSPFPACGARYTCCTLQRKAQS